MAETFGWQYPAGTTDKDFDLPEPAPVRTFIILRCPNGCGEWEAEAVSEDGKVTLCDKTDERCPHCGDKGEVR